MVDANWAVKQSTSGWVFTYNQAAITWASKKQKTIALSTCEAELVAASESCKDAVHLSTLLTEIGEDNMDPISVSTDNTAAQAVSHNPEFKERTKHVARRHFWIRELVEDGRIAVPYVKTDHNLADFLTKPLPWSRFVLLRDRIMNVRADDGPGGSTSFR